MVEEYSRYYKKINDLHNYLSDNKGPQNLIKAT